MEPSFHEEGTIGHSSQRLVVRDDDERLFELVTPVEKQFVYSFYFSNRDFPTAHRQV